MSTAIFSHTIEDQEREELVNHQLLLRQMMRAVVMGPDAGSDCLVALRAFHDYFASMVLFEESLMSLSDYPDLEDHHGQHGVLIRELEDLLHAETTTDHAMVRIGIFLVHLRIHLYRSDGLFTNHLLDRERLAASFAD